MRPESRAGPHLGGLPTQSEGVSTMARRLLLGLSKAEAKALRERRPLMRRRKPTLSPALLLATVWGADSGAPQRNASAF
jgi:hypothetical protein